ncbi:hypothetical protein R5R35_012344 [Gryllus longicercus]|uniref:Folylpolyglutamate synthase n=1 Tax=Gryllus longicercus TaxID=2509291 RepID=A0AAN9VFH6_9ORTH
MVKDTLSIHLPSRLTSNVCPSPVRDYEAAVSTLNSLQTNTALLDSYKKQGRRNHSVQQLNLSETVKYLSRTNVTLEQLDTLSVIHVTGTKGKGSTCAFCESILRHHGFKTGFYSSPHLVSVRERIRINGKPLSEEQFTAYFWQVYRALYDAKENEHDMPPYFRFLTVMAFNVFLIEKVDVAIVEVGIGGEYDCTNVLRKVPVVGITSLGMDHMSLLGNSIEEIAWQKGGIFKPGATAFTVNQPSGVWDVLSKRANERECILEVVPPLEEYDWGIVDVMLPHSKRVQTLNASLALQLANAWMLRRKSGSPNVSESLLHHNEINGSNSVLKALAFPVTSKMLMGLCKCSWPGRLQVLEKGPISFFLDGAHTMESIEMCSQWFLLQQRNSRDVMTILIFNVGGERDIFNFLAPLIKCKFDVAVFCPNVVERCVPATSDQANLKVSADQQQTSSKRIHKIWNSFSEDLLNTKDVETKNEQCEETTNVHYIL